jgi:hypothetical protein
MTQELLGRVHRELLDVLNSINQDKIHHDGDDFHELLNDVENALAQTEQEPVADDIASILACRDMLDAQPVPEVDRVIWPEHTEQEPVAFASHGVINWIADKQFQHEADLYTTPPQRTEPAQQKKVWTFWDLSGGDITDAIKAKLKEKNT